MKKKLIGISAVLLAAAVGCGDDNEPGGGGAPVDLQITGMSAPATVSFDGQGVLHATCQTDEDCAAVLGYYHAKNRFWQMDTQRRVSRGTLAELIPAAGTGKDEFLRHYLSTSTGEPIEEAIWAITDEGTKAIVEAYTAGVNSWLADARAGRNDATLTEEYRLGAIDVKADEIPDWDPLDTIAIARLLTWQLSDDSVTESSLGAAFPRLPVERAVALFTPAQATTTFTMPASGVSYFQETAGVRAMRAPFSLESVAAVQARLGIASRALEEARAKTAASELPLLGGVDDPKGSNNWVVAPQRTANGNALLANDPHLPLSNPGVWYFVDMDAKSEGTGSIHVAGGSFPGIPGVPIGRNENVAWGATVAYYDDTDLYVETLTEDGSAVLFDTDGDGTPEEVEIVSKDVQFGPANNRKTVTLKWVPHHGPILSEDLANRVAISARWTGHEATNELKAFLDVARASTVAEAKAALQQFEVGAQNFVLVDTNGSIGWYPHARVPVRSWASYSQTDPSGTLPPWLPLPGDGSAEWEGFLPADELPQMFDPPEGFIATANQDMTGATADGDPTNESPYLQAITAAGFRETRVVELLEEIGDQHTPETMIAIQADVHSLPGAYLVPAMLAAVDPGALSEDAQAVAAALEDWEYGCPTGLASSDPDGPVSTDPTEAKESIGCSAFHYLLSRVFANAYGDELRASGAPADSNLLIRPLTLALGPARDVQVDPAVLWDDLETTEVTEDAATILTASFEDAAAQLARAFGTDPNEWRWGRVHTITFESLVGDLAAAESVTGINNGPYANDGGLFTVDVANPPSLARGSGFAHGSGASLRIVNEATADGIKTWLQVPGGQDLHRDGEHYGDLVDGWLANESFVFPFTREEVDAAAVTTLRVGP
ncbi:penicillin acylase family protein [Vulgatibacter sp.]|uniref:penicillin acylase family protein n=1 Tax=Vulgatibacter sp. TaxID=1971226 RepID=UPI003566D9BF